ncbi:MAG: zinc ABC transporter substrate-binding protein [Candidatus Brocadiae bacterium]|nr:zinc ABC transporter substrate-binding protein [Candidatus Brocadiia bacterium]
MNRFHLLAAAAIALPALGFLQAGCRTEPKGKPVVAATIPVLADFLQQVGGAHVEVRLIVKPHESPHGFRPGPDHVRLVAETRAVFANGLGLEPWLDGLLGQAAGERKVHLATRGVSPIQAANGADLDPHAWLDPVRAVTYVQNARDLLISLDPDREPEYRYAAETYIEQLRGLDGDINSMTGGMPPDRKRLLLPHDSMRYFGSRYGFHTAGLAPPGVPATEEMKLEALDWLAEKRTPAMFQEAGHDEEEMRKLLYKRGGGRLSEPLFTDTLDAPGKPTGSYLGAMRHNASQIREMLR